jgi:hypothetical protein
MRGAGQSQRRLTLLSATKRFSIQLTMLFNPLSQGINNTLIEGLWMHLRSVIITWGRNSHKIWRLSCTPRFSTGHSC